MHMAHVENQIQPTKEPMFAGSKSIYADPVFENLLNFIKPKIEKDYGKELVPTYSFWRMYTYNSDLFPHIDRASCEISATVMFGSDGTKWPFFVDGNKFDLEPGDAVLYLGTKLKHWRETFLGDWHAQGFLHYVDQEGPHAEWKRDKRPQYALRNEYLAKLDAQLRNKKGDFDEVPLKEKK